MADPIDPRQRRDRCITASGCAALYARPGTCTGTGNAACVNSGACRAIQAAPGTSSSCAKAAGRADVVILDLDRRGLAITDVIKQIKATSSATILAYVSHVREDAIREARAAGLYDGEIAFVDRQVARVALANAPPVGEWRNEREHRLGAIHSDGLARTALPPGQLAQDLALPVEDLNLTVRSYNCLKREGIHTVGELISRSEQDLLDIRNFGAKSIDEVKAKLVEMGLSLKDSAPGFDPHAALAAYGDDDSDDAFVEDEQY